MLIKKDGCGDHYHPKDRVSPDTGLRPVAQSLNVDKNWYFKVGEVDADRYYFDSSPFVIRKKRHVRHSSGDVRSDGFHNDIVFIECLQVLWPRSAALLKCGQL